MAVTVNIQPGKYPVAQSIELGSTLPGAIIRYTLDGSDPRTFMSSVYTPGEVIAIPSSCVLKTTEILHTGVPTVTVVTATPVQEFSYVIFDPSIDSDSDTIPDGLEGNADSDSDGAPDSLDIDSDSDSISDKVEAGSDGLHPLDTDSDGIPDYLDADSDDDGLPDSLERDDDFDNDGIPNRLDPDQVPNLIVNIHNFPSNMVENVPYTFTVEIRNGSGSMTIVNQSGSLLGIESTEDPIPVSAGQVFTYTIMASVCRASDELNLSFSFLDAITGLSEDFSFDILVLRSDLQHPIQGIKITWKKNPLAKFYAIYRKRPEDLQTSRIIIVPHDTTTGYTYQWYMDRQGTVDCWYSVSVIDSEGVEGPKSSPRHAPDISSDTCLIQGNVADVGMTAVSDVMVGCRVLEIPGIFGNTAVLRTSNIVRTDSRGYFELYVPRKALIVLSIEDAGLKKSLLIPDVPSIDIRGLLALPQNGG